MPPQETLDVDAFRFRGLHPSVYLGTASDRYAGWLGQIYPEESYADRITRRQHTVGGKRFTESVLPVDCVASYFEHFRVLELDFTFYRPLLDREGTPTQNHRVLAAYGRHVPPGDRLLLKVPQAVFAQKVRRRGGFVENEDYLDPALFTRSFYTPARELLGDRLAGFLFEQEYQRKQDRVPAAELASRLDAFFRAVPADGRYHVELRTEALLAPPVFEVLERHGVGQVLSHWSWLPSLRRQLALSGGRVLNGRGEMVVRLLTPRGMRYEDAYARAHPFDRLVDGMLDARMVGETAELMWGAIERKARVNVIVNNRAGGNAPAISQEIARAFLSARPRDGVAS